MQERKLLTILFADIVGYTAMMQADEPRAMRSRTRFRDVLNARIPAHNGQIAQFYGDGCLATFTSGRDAVHCAVAIQKAVGEEPTIPVRVGMHLGDVTVDDDGVYGDAVNIAARVESFAVPGAVFLSRRVYDQVHNQPDIDCKSLGKFRMKNVADPIELFAVANDNLPVPDPNTLEGKGEKTLNSIAVLAFSNMSSDPDQDFFGDGISEEIINALVKLPELKVAGRTSSFSFKGRDMDLREVGRQLGVSNVLEGSVRKAGSRVRVTAQLINVEDGFHLWSERYDRELEDIFAIQDDIATNISEKLKVTLLEKRSTIPLVQVQTENIEAYQWYLRGRYYLERRTNVQQARQCFERARDLDNNYALAWSGLAYTLFYEMLFDGFSPLEKMPGMKQAAEKALSLDPNLAEAWVMKGLPLSYFDWDYPAAEAAYDRALELNPYASDTYRVKAYFHSLLGDTKTAVRLGEKALELDPLSVNIRMSHGELLYRDHRFDEAIASLEPLAAEFPGLSAIHSLLANCYYFTGQHQKALHATEEAFRTLNAPMFYMYTNLWSLAQMNHSDRAEEIYTQLNTRFADAWISPVARALVELALDRPSNAETLFQQALQDHDPILLIMNIEPTLEGYKEKEMVRKCLEEIGVG